MTDDSEKFIQELSQQRNKANTLEPLFKNAQTIELPIVSDDEKVNCIRNIKCTSSKCIYEYGDLQDLYKQQGGDPKKQFECFNCKTQICLMDFYMDKRYQQIVKESFGKYNHGPFLNVLTVSLDKNYKWKPIFTQHPNVIIPINNALPNISLYDSQELENLEKQYTSEIQSWLKSKSPPIKFLNTELPESDLDEFLTHKAIVPNLMTYLLRLVINNQKRVQPTLQIQIQAAVIESIVGPQVKFQYIPGFENYLESEEKVADFNYIVIVLYFDKLWNLGLIQKGTQIVYLINQHEEQPQVASNLMKLYCTQQIGIKYSKIEAFSAFMYPSVFYHQSGHLTFFFLHQVIMDNSLDILRKIKAENVKALYDNNQATRWAILKTIMIDYQQIIDAKEQEKKLKAQKENEEKQKAQQEEEKKKALEEEQKRKQLELLQQQQQMQMPKENSSVQDGKSLISQPNSHKSKDPMLPQDQQKSKQASIQQSLHQSQQIVAPPPQELQKEPSEKRSTKSYNQVLRNLTGHNQTEENKQDPKKERVKLTKIELADLMERLKDKMMQEIKNPKKPLYEEYMDKIKQAKKDFYNEEAIFLSGQELREIFQLYEEDVKIRLKYDNPENFKNIIRKELEIEDQMQKYQAFQQLLWYYYTYNPDMYKQLVDEYNHRFHNMVLSQMGLNQNYSVQQQLNNNRSHQRLDPLVRGSLNSQQSQLYSQHNIQKPNSVYSSQIFPQKLEPINGEYTRNHNYRRSQNNSQINDDYNDLNGSMNSGQGPLPRNKFEDPMDDNDSRYQQKIKNLIGNASPNISNRSNKILSREVSAQQFNLQDRKDDAVEVIAKRYDRTITKSEYLKMKFNGLVSENIFSFFVRFLEERHKMGNPERQSMFGNRILFMSTSFYKYLTNNDLYSDSINYNIAKHYTKQYTGSGNTIFEQIDKIIVPLLLGPYDMQLAVIDLPKKQFALFEVTQSKVKVLEAINSPILQNLKKFIDKESCDKLMKNINILQWEFIFEECSKAKDFKLSTLYIAYYIHQISQKKRNFKVQEDQIFQFKDQLTSLISVIGITKNLKNELAGQMNHFPL